MTGRKRSPLRRRRRTLLPEFPFDRVGRWAVAAALVLCGVLLVVGQSDVRPFEARVGSLIMGSAQIDGARAIGTVLLFRAQGALVGVQITASCSIALLISPFCLLTAGLVISRRISVQRGLVALGVAVLWLFVLNQARIMIIVLAMRAWGLERGYELSHVLLGTVISTLGVLGGLVIFVVAVTRSRSPATAAV